MSTQSNLIRVGVAKHSDSLAIHLLTEDESGSICGLSRDRLYVSNKDLERSAQCHRCFKIRIPKSTKQAAKV